MIFKPMLAPNQEIDLNTINYTCLASYKLDGIRCIFYKGQILSRSLKPIQNKQLKEKFEPIRLYTEQNNIILDGEIYSPELTFQEITRFVMTRNFEDKKTIKKFRKVLTIPEHLKFYCFDTVIDNNFTTTFNNRINYMIAFTFCWEDIFELINQVIVTSPKEVENYFEEALSNGFEGLILKDPDGKYKCGRGTIKEGLIYKVKLFVDFDSKIIDIEQATIVNPNAEKKTNELGRSVTSKKKEDRILIERASGFIVKYEDKELTVPLGKHTNKQKDDVWKNKKKYIGKWIEYQGMEIGMKDVPRIPRFVRYREDKD